MNVLAGGLLIGSAFILADVICDHFFPERGWKRIACGTACYVVAVNLMRLLVADDWGEDFSSVWTTLGPLLIGLGIAGVFWFTRGFFRELVRELRSRS